jgi:hypothetical protein
VKYAGSRLVDFEYLAGSAALEMKRRFIDHAKMSCVRTDANLL